MKIKNILFPYLIYVIIDSQFQILIYLLFYNYFGVVGLSYVFLSKYVLKNFISKFYTSFIHFKSIKTIFLLISVLFLCLLIKSNIIILVILSSLIIILLSSINIKYKTCIQQVKENTHIKNYSLLLFVSSVGYLLGAIIVFLEKSNISIICISISIFSILAMILSSKHENKEQELVRKKMMVPENKKVPSIFIIVLVTGVLAILIDNYELPYIINVGLSENMYSLVIFFSGFFYIIASYVLGKIKSVEAKFELYTIIGCIICLIGYFLFTLSSNVMQIILSMGIIAAGYVVFGIFMNSYVSFKYSEYSEYYFLQITKLESIVLTIIFSITNISLRDISVVQYYEFLRTLLVIYILLLLILLLKRRNTIKSKVNN